MAHKKATPENERPTLEEVRIRENFARMQVKKTVEVSGYWEQQSDGCRPEFQVTISGDAADVDEVVESVLENGNLHDLKVVRKRTEKR